VFSESNRLGGAAGIDDHHQQDEGCSSASSIVVSSTEFGRMLDDDDDAIIAVKKEQPQQQDAVVHCQQQNTISIALAWYRKVKFSSTKIGTFRSYFSALLSVATNVYIVTSSRGVCLLRGKTPPCGLDTLLSYIINGGGDWSSITNHSVKSPTSYLIYNKQQ
jgi:hypothetical protein